MKMDTLLIWIQGGLLDAITPYLRAVVVSLDPFEERQLFYFYYDCEITDELFELASVASTEASCACDYFSEDHILKLEFPQKIPILGRLAYLRNEPGAEQYVQKKYEFDDELPIVKLLLYVQQALLGRVTKNLRMLSVGLDAVVKKLGFYFVYDGPISIEDRVLANAIIDEAVRPFTGYEVQRYLERIDFPQKPPSNGERVVYARYEDSSQWVLKTD